MAFRARAQVAKPTGEAAPRSRSSGPAAAAATPCCGAAAGADVYHALKSSTVFAPLRKPKRGDWLDEHEERGQSLAQFGRVNLKATPHATFDTIGLVVFGEGTVLDAQLPALKAFMAAFFSLKVEIIGPIPLDKVDTLRTRINGDTGAPQAYTSGLLDYLRKVPSTFRELSRRLAVTIGVTMMDITNREDWNFVYGLAQPADGVGVFSLARFSPAFNGEACASEDDAARVVLERACKVLCHELGHLFGLKHCIEKTCLMNGCNHVGELQLQPLLECPACTEKLASVFAPKFWPSLTARYTALGEQLHAIGAESEHRRVVEGILPLLAGR